MTLSELFDCLSGDELKQLGEQMEPSSTSTYVFSLLTRDVDMTIE
jgi:hypothetical protein